MKKRKTTLARQLKVKRQEDSFDTFQDSSFDVVACAADIKTNMSNHRRALESNLQACTAALDDMESIDDHADVRDKIRQLEYMYRVLNEKYNELLQYTVRLEAATELAITSRHRPLRWAWMMPAPR